MTRRPVRTAAACLALALAMAGCSAAEDDPSSSARPTATVQASSSPSASADQHTGHQAGATPAGRTPLRSGERLVELAMPRAYTPSAPYGTGTDDYRCFVLDPHLDEDAFITGLNILPGNRDVVHHVILFRAPPETLDAVGTRDAEDPGQGWTCFGDTGVEQGPGALDDAPWLGAWAPGGGEQVMARDVGVPIAAGSKVIMQVHYNLLAGKSPDVSAAQLRLAPGSKDLAPLRTMLLPGPVELPCRPQHDDGPLCERAAAVSDVQDRFGFDAGRTADFIHLLCGPIRAGAVQTCDRPVNGPATLRAVAGHMHLLGRSIKVEVNPDTPDARTVLDIPVWDFDDQGARPVKPVPLDSGDTVRVTCRHDQRLRDLLPAFEGQPDRYVVWGEGTTDEMCLGILLMTRP
jgi:hypothetical protein